MLSVPAKDNKLRVKTEHSLVFIDSKELSFLNRNLYFFIRKPFINLFLLEHFIENQPFVIKQ